MLGWRAYAGNENDPAVADTTASRAGDSQFCYTEDPEMGHNVWSCCQKKYRLLPDGQRLYDWLFAQ